MEPFLANKETWRRRRSQFKQKKSCNSPLSQRRHQTRPTWRTWCGKRRHSSDGWCSRSSPPAAAQPSWRARQSPCRRATTTHAHKDMKRQTPVTLQPLHNAGWSVTAYGSKSVAMNWHTPVKLIHYSFIEEIVM